MDFSFGKLKRCLEKNIDLRHEIIDKKILLFLSRIGNAECNIKFDKLKEENDKLKEENDKLKEENDKLKEEIIKFKSE